MTETQFDEKMRELLSEPQEQLPEGLWEGIASRLDEAEGKRRRAAVPVFRWLAGASAVAAAVAAGLVISHFVPSGQVPDGGILAESAAVDMPAERAMGETVPAEKVAGVEDLGAKRIADAGKKDAGKEKEVKFDVVKSENTGLVAMAAVPEYAGDAERVKRAGNIETAGEAEEAGKAANVEEIEDVKEVGTVPPAGTEGLIVDVDAEGGEPECDLKVDNSDIEAAYGREEDSDGAYRGSPFEISVGGNSFGGPQKSATQKKMFSKGHKTPTGKTFVEGVNSDSYSLPLSFGVGVKYSITKWLGIGLGVNYTLLNKKVTGTYYDEHDWSCSTDMKNSQHYIGIPLDIYFSMFRTNRWDAYATVGGAVEKCILNRYTGTFEGESLLYTKKVSGVQTSVKAGLGVEFSPLEFLGIYIDPSVRYYFNNNQPRSIRTAQPWAFGVEAGLRFKL